MYGLVRVPVDNCRDLLSPLADAGKLDPHTLLTLAMAEDQGHFRSAAADYRRVISVGQTSGTTQPADMQAVAAAANNLANLLMSQNDPAALTEAQNLAGLAVADSQGDPAAPYYHDTLGRIDLLESKFDAAAGEFQTADGLAPGNPAILIGWADALARGNKMQDAVVKLQAAERISVGYAVAGEYSGGTGLRSEVDRQGTGQLIETPAE